MGRTRQLDQPSPQPGSRFRPALVPATLRRTAVPRQPVEAKIDHQFPERLEIDRFDQVAVGVVLVGPGHAIVFHETEAL